MDTDWEHTVVELAHGETMTVGRLLTGWTQHVERLVREAPLPVESDTWGADDYFAALFLRDLLAVGLRRLPHDAATTVAPLVAAPDGALANATEPDEGGLVRRFGLEGVSRRPPAEHWWWDRIPVTGLVREELHEWAASA